MKNILNQSERSFIIDTFTNGGANYNPIFLTKPVNGFMVSVSSEFKKPLINGKDNSQSFRDAINHFNATEFSRLSGESYFVGSWVETEKDNTQTICFDLSFNTSDLKEAIKIGILNGQKAIFDLNKGKEIKLPIPQKSGTISQQLIYAEMKAEQLTKNIG